MSGPQIRLWAIAYVIAFWIGLYFVLDWMFTPYPG